MAGMTRLLQAGTPLGAGVLTLQRMAGKEELGRLPEFELGFVSRRGDIKPEEILGKNITWTLELADGAQRYFNGFVTSFADDGESDAGLFEAGGKGTVYLYTATVHPWLWFLTRAANCRIFQNLSVPEIVDQVFKDYKFADTKKVQLRADYPKKEFNVQYRESDFNFVCRLLEQEGIYFAFEYDDGKNTLVLMDSQGAHKATPALEAPFHHDTAALRTRTATARGARSARYQPGKYVVDEFDWMKPRVAMSGDGLPEVRKPHDLAEFEIYDYPGEYDQPAEERSTRRRASRSCRRRTSVRGAGNVRRPRPGRQFKLQDHPRRRDNARVPPHRGEYAARRASHASGAQTVRQFSATSWRSAPTAAVPPARRSTPKPSAAAADARSWSARRARRSTPTSTAASRCSSTGTATARRTRTARAGCASRSRGPARTGASSSIPRIGQEVIVDFLEGDPDRPIVTGRVYNAEDDAALRAARPT